MRTIFTIIIASTLLNIANAQIGEWYSTSGWEMPFQFANVNANYVFNTSTGEKIESVDSKNIMRWAPVLNLNFYANYDFSKSVGMFTGFTLRNVGFITDLQSTNDTIPIYHSATKVRKKYRTYNIGVPLGLKFGKLNGFFFYAGFQVEYAFNYKEKTFVDDKKEERFTVWFGDRAEQFPMSLFAGFQTKHGLNVKFQYYLNNFHNKDFYSSAEQAKIYNGFDANVFYFSLNFAVFKNTDLYYKEYKEEDGAL